jgi:hypothetical protein
MSVNKPVLEKMRAIQGDRLIQFYRVEIPQNGYDEKHYECTVHSTLSPDSRQPISEIDSKIGFSVSKTLQEKEYTAIFSIHSTEIACSNPEVQKLLEVSQLLAVPTKETVCLLNSNGKIKKILNTGHIYKKWNEVFNLLQQQSTDAIFLDKLSDTGHREFRHIIDGIEKTHLYNMFFFPLFSEQFVYGSGSETFYFTEDSHLMKGTVLYFHVLLSSLEIVDDIVTFNLTGHAVNGNELFSKLKGEFASIMNEHSKYEVNMSLQYTVDAVKGYPVHIMSKLKERVTGTICYEQTMEIKEMQANLSR